MEVVFFQLLIEFFLSKG